MGINLKVHVLYIVIRQEMRSTIEEAFKNSGESAFDSLELNNLGWLLQEHI